MPSRHFRTAMALIKSRRSDQGIRSPMPEKFDTIEGINGEQKPGGYFACTCNPVSLRKFAQK